jgi:hypothetical protein
MKDEHNLDAYTKAFQIDWHEYRDMIVNDTQYVLNRTEFVSQTL